MAFLYITEFYVPLSYSFLLSQDDGILVVPTVADPPLKLRTKKGLSSEFLDRTLALTSIASMSGCCQVNIFWL